MPNSIADRFTEALSRLESDRDLDLIASLFSDNAEIGNVIAPEKFHGQKGARDFWTKYRDTFESLKSTFRNRIIDESGRIALEWSTRGTSAGGNQLEYDGVSILETEGDNITRFRAYFDAGGLGRQMETEDMKVTHD